jgi:hypothetical protein
VLGFTTLLVQLMDFQKNSYSFRLGGRNPVPDEKKEAATATVSTASTATNAIMEVAGKVQVPPAPWRIIDYETSMFQWLRQIRIDGPVGPGLSEVIKNALAESYLLHVRNLCEIFLPEKEKKTDDLRPRDLFADWDSGARYFAVKRTIADLVAKYGRSGEPDTPRWHLNKRLAHSTRVRGESTGHDYTPHLKELVPLLSDVLGQIENLRRGADLG